MADSITTIKGMPESVVAALQARGIRTAPALLQAATTPAERNKLARELGIDATAVLEYANRADLLRIDGIGTLFANLLEDAGVDTVKELATRNPVNLHQKLAEVHEKAGRDRPPSLDEVEAWIAEAATLPRGLEH